MSGHIYLIYCDSVGIIKVGMTTREPNQYLKDNYKPKQLWQKILVLPVEDVVEAERGLIDTCKAWFRKADGYEYFFCEALELKTVVDYMLNVFGE